MKAPLDDSTIKKVSQYLKSAQHDLQALKDTFLLSEQLDNAKMNELIYHLECYLAGSLRLLPEAPPDGFEWKQCEACGAWTSTAIPEPSWGEILRQEAIAGARAKAYWQDLGPHPSLYEDAAKYGQALPREQKSAADILLTRVGEEHHQ